MKHTTFEQALREEWDLVWRVGEGASFRALRRPLAKAQYCERDSTGGKEFEVASVSGEWG